MTKKQNKVLMCPPVYFRVDYSINPWMKNERVDLVKVKDQWHKLYNIIKSLGVEIEMIAPHKDYPDLVFAANAGAVKDKKVVLSNFKHIERQGEKLLFEKWFKDNGYETHELADNLSFEGCGDCVVVGEELLAGYGFRSDYEALEQTAKILNLNLSAHELKDPRFYHMDTCLTVIDKENKLGFYYDKAIPNFDDSSYSLYPVKDEDALAFCCNSVVIGDNIIMPAGSGDDIVDYLKSNNYNVFKVEMSEFLKSGGACQCLVLEI